MPVNEQRPRLRAVQQRRLIRTARPVRVAGTAAARWALTYLARGERRQAKRRQAVLRTAEDVRKTMGEMKGAVMKVGQILSMMTGTLPEEMARELATLQASAPPMAYELVEQVFIEEFGEPPEARFRSFEREPFAAASIGQVHRARLRDGTRVAVKVQYPGVGEAIEQDLANVGMLIGWLALVAKGLDAGTIVRDLTEGIRAELDYRREAAWQERFHQRYAGHAFIRVPRVHHEESGERVLVQELLEGKPFAAAVELPQPERNRIGEIVYRYAFGSLYRHGLFNGDPHPGNYLILPGGAVGFVDYGCISEFSPAVVDGFGAIIRALVAGDLPRWRAAVEHAGILHREAPYTTEQLYEHLHWFWAPILAGTVEFTPELAGEMVRRNAQTTGEGGAINKWCNIPEGMVFLTRINFGLAGLMAGLRAAGPWQGIIREYVDGAPPCTVLGEQSAATSVGLHV